MTPEERKIRASIAGRASAMKLSPEQRHQRSIQNGMTTLARFGQDYFKSLGTKSAFFKSNPTVVSPFKKHQQLQQAVRSRVKNG